MKNYPTAEIVFVGMARRKDSNGNPAAEMPGWLTIAAAIKDAVETSGLPVSVIAKKADISRQHLYSMMAGTTNPTVDTIEAVMKVAGTPLQTWLDDKAMYGRDKRLHDLVQHILNERGTNAVALKRTIEGLAALMAHQAENSQK
jgi:hypothetical protein